MPTIEDAILLALQAHRNSRDKGNAPYILHPLRVMTRMASIAEMMAAVLHDVVEDSGYTISDLQKAGYPEEVVEAVRCLTRGTGETYDDFIQRVAANFLASKVKIADLEDNLNLGRITVVQEKDVQRFREYKKAWLQLTQEQRSVRWRKAGEHGTDPLSPLLALATTSVSAEGQRRPFHYLGESLSDLIAFALHALHANFTAEETCRPALYGCTTCGDVPLKLTIMHQSCSAQTDFRGVILGTCFECARTEEQFGYTRPQSGPGAKEEPSCECGNPYFFMLGVERFETNDGVPWFFDDGVIVGKCSQCGKCREFVSYD